MQLGTRGRIIATLRSAFASGSAPYACQPLLQRAGSGRWELRDSQAAACACSHAKVLVGASEAGSLHGGAAETFVF